MLADSLAKVQGVTIHKLELPAFTKQPLALIGSIFTFIGYFIRLRSLLRRVEPDLIYGNTIRNYITCLYAHMLGYPCILQIHEKNVGMPAGLIIAGIMGRYAERVLYVSEFARRSYEVRSASLRSRGITIHNGIQIIAEKEPNADMLDMIVPKGFFPLLATAANLAPHKRLDDLIEAMEKIAQEYPQALLLIAGEGTHCRHLEELVENNRYLISEHRITDYRIRSISHGASLPGRSARTPRLPRRYDPPGRERQPGMYNHQADIPSLQARGRSH